jgi:hypothetical protein
VAVHRRDPGRVDELHTPGEQRIAQLDFDQRDTAPVAGVAGFGRELTQRRERVLLGVLVGEVDEQPLTVAVLDDRRGGRERQHAGR